MTPSATYETRRSELLEAEAALRDQRERVAELRRALPEGPLVDDYTLRAVPGGEDVQLSSLFGDHDSLVVYHFMFGADWDAGCPMCSMWLDGLDGVAHHIGESAGFAVIAKASPSTLAAWAERRGWRRLRLYSSGETSFGHDLGVENEAGEPDAAVSVFRRRPDGTIELTYTGKADWGELGWRGIDLLSPVWQVLDLLPGGRGDWMPHNV